jgi:hypothetical protein
LATFVQQPKEVHAFRFRTFIADRTTGFTQETQQMVIISGVIRISGSEETPGHDAREPA